MPPSALQQGTEHAVTALNRASSSDTVRPPATRNRMHPSTGPDGQRSPSKRSSMRVIRTYEEVQKIVVTEEWYDELECGICAHILGATQTLVPCGHSFCGPCAWQWIMINKNITCPHCRMQVSSDIPFVPSIVLEQIVERKLRGLQDGEQKTDLLVERAEKAQAWKVLQTTLPDKPKTRSRGFEEWFGLFESGGDGNGPRRRASRHLVELGSPLNRDRPVLGSGDLTLSDLRRLDAEQQGVLQRVNLRLAPPDPTEAATNTNRVARPHFSRTPTFAGSASPPASRPQVLRTSSGPLGRPIIVRSQALAARQSRGRTRDDPLLVHSDSESSANDQE